MSQEIGDPAAGYALRPPDGWEAAPQEGRIMLAPPEGETLVMAIPHAASGPDEIAPLFEQGWTEPGLVLTPAGSPEKREDGSVALELTGRANEEEARGSLLVLFGPHGGGLILMGVARAGAPEDPAVVVGTVADTVRFSEPDTVALLEGWNQILRGKKLSYFYTYSSGPLGGGITERHELVLREDGRFEQEGEFVASMGDAGGTAEEVWPPTGDWEILAAAGQALVELRGEGETEQYVLAQGGEGVLLNGRRYFVSDP